MKKKILLPVIFCFTTGVALAHNHSHLDAETNGATKLGEVSLADMSKLPQPGDGVKFVPLSEIYHPKLSEEDEKILKMAAVTGYQERKSADAEELSNLLKNKYYPANDDRFYHSNDPQDTHMKESLSQIQLAFKFHPLSFVAESDVIGYAVSHGWENGWTGVSEYFKMAPFDICRYNRSDVKLNQSAIRLSKESIQDYINGKPAFYTVEGNEEQGFAYFANWYANDYFHELSCYKKEYSTGYKKDLIHIAKSADRE